MQFVICDCFFFSSRRRHTRCSRDWSSDVCSSDLPAPAPLVPDWDLFGERGYKQIVFSEIPCNWFQGQENSIDPIHFEWLHSNWSAALRGEPGARAPRHLKIAFEEFEWGFVYRRVREDTTEDDDLWTVGRVCLWPNCLYTGKF